MLRELRLTGGIFLDGEFTAPWCVLSKVEPEDCTQFTSRPCHLIAYHYVISGRLFLNVDGQAPIPVEGGEIVVLPRNEDHVIGSAPDLKPINAEPLIQSGEDGKLARIIYGGGGERTHILCGYLGNDMPHSAIFSMLPSVLKINVAEGASGNWIESSFRFAAQELANTQAHSPPILARLAELLFMEAVRRYLESHPPARGAWTAGMRDTLVGRALGLLHGQISRRWTTESLAKEIGLSRSAFAERFTRIVGEPPMRYITRQRLEQAARQLGESSASIPQIASSFGYESEAAFSRAFKREYGVPPAAWRREKRQLKKPDTFQNET
jgi:AraC-like DNA-binding protein